MLTLSQLHTLADDCIYDFWQQARMLSEDDEGCLGFGADLEVQTLLHAYRSGVFPWFLEGQIPAWWSPTPRCVLKPISFKPKRSLIRTAKKSTWTLTTNHAFGRVIQACREPRAYADETWIGNEMVEAYTRLHELGVAVSVEVWDDTPLTSPLIGGLYGLSMGAVFCGESMFHRTTDASKIAFWALMTWCQAAGMTLVDCQLENPHLMSLGAELMGRHDFLMQLHQLVQTDVIGLGEQKLTLSASTLASLY